MFCYFIVCYANYNWNSVPQNNTLCFQCAGYIDHTSRALYYVIVLEKLLTKCDASSVALSKPSRIIVEDYTNWQVCSTSTKTKIIRKKYLPTLKNKSICAYNMNFILNLYFICSSHQLQIIHIIASLISPQSKLQKLNLCFTVFHMRSFYFPVLFSSFHYFMLVQLYFA